MKRLHRASQFSSFGLSSQKNVHNLLISLSMFCLQDKSSMNGLAIEFKLAFSYYKDNWLGGR